MLALGGARAADGYIEAAPAVASPPLARRRNDVFERHLDAAGGLGHLADDLEKARGGVRNRGAIHPEREAAKVPVVPAEAAFPAGKYDGVPLQILQLKSLGKRVLGIDRDKRVNAATGAAGGDAHEPARGFQTEVNREIGDHEKPKRLGDLAGLDVVF